MANTLFNPEQFQTIELKKKIAGSTIKDVENTSKIRFNCYELGNTIDFMSDDIYPILRYSLPIQDIISTEIRIEKKKVWSKIFTSN